MDMALKDRDTDDEPELEVLLEKVYLTSGYDFRQYSRESLRRRVRNILRSSGLSTLRELQDRVLRDPELMEGFVQAVTVNVSSMFRDPGFFLALRDKVLPYLCTYPFIRIWVAGCATGEEAYSVAIILEEEGIYDRCRIYATDINDRALERAREGLFNISCMKEYTRNYMQAGGRGCFSDYYTAAYGNAVFCGSLRRNIIFARHNLAEDRVFNTFQLILCRNVTIYFNAELKKRVHNLLYDSLVIFGILGLGTSENIDDSGHRRDYEVMDRELRLYKKIHQE